MVGEAIPKAEVGNFIWAIGKGNYGFIYVLSVKCHRFPMSTICNAYSWDSSGPCLPSVALRNSN